MTGQEHHGGQDGGQEHHGEQGGGQEDHGEQGGGQEDHGGQGGGQEHHEGQDGGQEHHGEQGVHEQGAVVHLQLTFLDSCPQYVLPNNGQLRVSFPCQETKCGGLQEPVQKHFNSGTTQEQHIYQQEQEQELKLFRGLTCCCPEARGQLQRGLALSGGSQAADQGN